MKINIWQPTGQKNTACIPFLLYMLVATVEAKDFRDAYNKSQETDPDYAEKGIRATTVGDVLQDARNETICHLIKAEQHFVPVPVGWVDPITISDLIIS